MTPAENKQLVVNSQFGNFKLFSNGSLTSRQLLIDIQRDELSNFQQKLQFQDDDFRPETAAKIHCSRKLFQVR